MIKDKFFCGLDIGFSKIKASLLRYSQSSMSEIVGVAQASTYGIEETSLSHLTEFSDCIRDVLSGLIKKTDVKIRNVHLGLPGHLIEKRKTATLIPLTDKGSKPITRFDLKKVERQACLLGVNLDERLLHCFLTQHVIDGSNAAINPLGLYGRKLESDSLLIILKNILLTNIMNAVHLAGFEIETVNLSSFYAAEMCISESEKKEGSLFLNIGSHCSDLIFFKDGLLRDIQIIPLGGNHLSMKISQDLRLPFVLAEEIKHSYATVIDSHEISIQGEILVKRDSGYIPITRQEVCASIMPAVKNFMDLVEAGISDSKLASFLNKGIVLGGGGSLLPGLIEYIEKRTRFEARIGKVSVESRHLNNPAVYAACIGLAQKSFSKSTTDALRSHDRSKIFSRFLDRTKELYYEYF